MTAPRHASLSFAAMLLALTLGSGASAEVPSTDEAARSGEAPSPALPAGHPAVEEGADPHAGASAPMGQALPRDDAHEDPNVPVGTVLVQAADGAGRPLAGAEITLGVLHNTVAKGESRTRVVRTADERGVARFDGLEFGSGVAYRAMILRDGATFSAPPLQLTAKAGAFALVHVYPVTHELPPYIVSQSLLYAEVKDDRVQLQQVFKIYNFGATAWVPSDLVVALPQTFTAFTAQQGMTDVGLDPVDKKGARLRGTFSPGEHEIDFRWQLPYSGEGSFSFDVGMPPHLAAMRVMAPASRNMKLEVQDFPSPQTTADGMGQRTLVTEKQFRRDEPPLTQVHVTLSGLPTEGPGKLVATLLAACGVVLGIVLGARKPKARGGTDERDKHLQELDALERARKAGSVGPKTYERARRELIDDLARTFVTAKTKKAPAKRPAA